MPDTNQKTPSKTPEKIPEQPEDHHSTFDTPENKKFITEALASLDDLVEKGKEVLNHPKVRGFLDHLKLTSKPKEPPKTP